MNDTKAAPPQFKRGAFALAAALLVAGAAFLYVKAGHGGKKAHSAACDASRTTAKLAGDIAKGDIAAFAAAKDPEPMTALTFNGPDGKPTTLEAFKGKALLVNIWATWCVPCRSEMPALDRLQKAAGSDKFEVVAINVDTSRLDRPKAFLDEIGVTNLKFYADPKGEAFVALRQNGGLLGLPTSYLVDAKGCEIGQLAGPAVWDSADALALVQSVSEAWR
jgi:thiol-disulfide isomerase/thioredoxin